MDPQQMEQLVDRRVEAAVQQALNQAMEQGIIGVGNGDGGNNGVNGTVVSQVKASKPKVFSGKFGVDPAVWTYYVDLYYEISGVKDEERKVMVAASYLVDRAATWWRNLAERARVSGVKPCNGKWDVFKEKLIQAFRPVNHVKLARDKLATLKQYGSVAKYNDEFISLCMQIPDIGEADKLDRYVRGLKYKVKRDVELAEPKTVEEAMNKASRIDSISFPYAGFPNFDNNGGSNNNSYAPMELGAMNGNKSFKSQGTSGKAQSGSWAQQINRKEFARRRKNGLCLRCGKSGHIARNCSIPPGNGKGNGSGKWQAH
jgi:hypothetical protein